MMIALAVLLMLFTTIATALSIASVYGVTAPRRRLLAPLSAAVPVSVLKPLCGADDALEANLETFFRQRWPHFELVFGVEGESDPAVAVVRRLRERYPSVRARLVIHDGKRALNPKVSNLRAMLEAGTHDVVVISDSNVAVEPDYLRLMLGQLLADPAVGLVSNLFAGTGERSLGATLENLHLNGPVAGSVAITGDTGGQAVSVGKSMLFRRSVFETLGGLEAVGSLLAEDFVMGRMFAQAGYKVRLCAGVIHNVCTATSVPRFLHRHLRWGLIRSRVTPAMYPFEPLFSPMAVALIAPLLGLMGPWPLIWGVALTLLRDGLQWVRLRGRDGLLHALPLGPVKELLVLPVWAIAPFLRTVSWRGRSYRVSTGTRLYAKAPQGRPRELRQE
ncbi:MAG: ceramide glucosyltransferase [Deltaproteobacteria bacterium HGW-Deltaproteobacteria-14]|jgi:ceramide glucosyltransferase|nr:MAG: ceramide glucosyltransferase [Deltaproteobacteria bacterium HGW-Deltaproteobacteria-14]